MIYITCPCTKGAVHAAWNCPTCHGTGWIENKHNTITSSKVLIDNTNTPFINTFKLKGLQ